MSYELTPENERFVQEAVGSGQFCDVSAVVNEALKLLQDRERRLANLRAEIQKGVDSGPSIPAAKVFAHLRERVARSSDRASE